MRALGLVFVLFTAEAFARSTDGLADALAARALLGPYGWARVVRIESPGDRGSGVRTGYPATTYALIFELSGILWFYCDSDGTQSLSVNLGSVEADKLDPGPLLRRISPRFGAWRWADESGLVKPAGTARPPNDCLIECVAILEQRIAIGTELRSPRLLFYYVDTPTGCLGHTVLLYETTCGLTAVDPDRPDRSIRVPARTGPDAASIARFLRGAGVARARDLKLDANGAGRPAAEWTALPAAVPPIPSRAPFAAIFG
jgi:hypothetical protein